MNEPSIVIVAQDSDLLAASVRTRLAAQGDRVISIHPSALGSQAVRLQDEQFRLNDQRVGGILFRSLPDTSFSEDFAAADRAFCDAEVRAIWLAAMQLDSVCAINRYDPSAWFEGAGWPVWRQRLIAGGVPVSLFAFGGSLSKAWWYPYQSYDRQALPGPGAARIFGAAVTDALPVEHAVIVDGEIVAGKLPASAGSAPKVLAESGTRLAAVIADSAGRVLVVDANPLITDISVASAISTHLARMFHDHLHCR